MTQHSNYRVVFNADKTAGYVLPADHNNFRLVDFTVSYPSGKVEKTAPYSHLLRLEAHADLDRLLARIGDYAGCLEHEAWLGAYPTTMTFAWDHEHQTYAYIEDLAGPPKGQEVGAPVYPGQTTITLEITDDFAQTEHPSTWCWEELLNPNPGEPIVRVKVVT